VAVLIDASILLEAERGRLVLEQHVSQRQDEEFFLCGADGRASALT
jgi:hypothetical protein